MVYAGKLVFGVVSGGVLLGTALAALVDPVPKAAPEPPWGSMISPPIASGPDYQFIEALPENLTPRNVPGGYAPAYALSELPEQWQGDTGMHRDYPYLDADYVYGLDPLPEGARVEPDAVLPSPPVVATVEAAAGRAETAAADAMVAKPAPETMPAGGPKLVRVSEALGGLY